MYALVSSITPNPSLQRKVSDHQIKAKKKSSSPSKVPVQLGLQKCVTSWIEGAIVGYTRNLADVSVLDNPKELRCLTTFLGSVGTTRMEMVLLGIVKAEARTISSLLQNYRGVLESVKKAMEISQGTTEVLAEVARVSDSDKLVAHLLTAGELQFNQHSHA